jgi:DNA-binding IclR family transcriptional regulator
VPYQRKKDTPSSILGRFLLILDVFGAAKSPLTLSEISRRTGLPLTTALRLLTQLTDSDALERTDDRRYRIGPRMAPVLGAAAAHPLTA